MAALMLSLPPLLSSAELSLQLGSDFAVPMPRLIVSFRLSRLSSLESFIGEVPVSLIALLISSLVDVSAAILFKVLRLDYFPPGANIFCTTASSLCFSFSVLFTFDGMVLIANPTPVGVEAGVARDFLLSAILLCLLRKGRLGGFYCNILYFLRLRCNFQDDLV
jgi:hypothetical protein